MTDSQPSTFRTQPSMLFRLRDWRDEASWARFYSLYFRFVYGQARGSGLSHHEAEEVAQEVFQRVAETIHQFEARSEIGSFRRWLINLTRWRIADKRRRNAKIPGAGGADFPPWEDRSHATAEFEMLPSSEVSRGSLEEEAWKRVLFDAALSQVGQRAAPQHLQVFLLHHRDGWSLVKIAKELGVSLASAYVINHRLTKQVKQEVERLRSELD